VHLAVLHLPHFFNPFERKSPTVKAIAVIPLTLTTLITTTAQEIGQFHIHKGGKLLTNDFFYIATDHLKKTSGY